MIVLPELVITGYTCSDLFLQEYLLEQAKRALGTIAEETAEVDAILFVGLPLAYNGKLYNVAAVLCRGEVHGFVPKTYLPNYNEFYEARHFARGMADPVEVDFEGECVPMGTRLFICLYVPPELKDRRGALRGFVDAGAAEYPSCQKWCDAACESVCIR